MINEKYLDECADLMVKLGFSPLYAACRSHKEFEIYVNACITRNQEQEKKSALAIIALKEIESELDFDFRGYEYEMKWMNRFKTIRMALEST